MNFIDIGIFVLVLLTVILGYKKGVIKTTVRLLGLIVITIISYVLKGVLANFLIGFMPFFDFGGIFSDIGSINILFYNGVSFVLIFILLYCILNILVCIAGLVDKVLKATVILYLPDKILGALAGLVEGMIYTFVIIIVLIQIPQTQEYVLESAFASNVINRTPIVRTVLSDTTVTTEEINELIKNYEDGDDLTDFHVEVLEVLIKYGMISKETAQQLIDEEKINLPGIQFN